MRRFLVTVPAAAVVLAAPAGLSWDAGAEAAGALPTTHASPSPGGSLPGADDMSDMDMSDMDGMDMGGMDHGAAGSHDHGSGSGSGTVHHDMPGMRHDEGPTPSRPRAAVLGGFAVLNGAVMGSAAVLRHRTKGKPTGRRAQAQRRRAAGARPASTRKADGR